MAALTLLWTSWNNSGLPCRLHLDKSALRDANDVEVGGGTPFILSSNTDSTTNSANVAARAVPPSSLHICGIAVMQVWMSLSFLGFERLAFDQCPGRVTCVSRASDQ